MSVRPSAPAISARVQSSLHSLHLLRKLNCCAFINHTAVCLTTGPKALPTPVLHTVRSSASSYNLQYPIFPLRPSSRCLLLLHRLPITVILRSVFPSITFTEAVPTQDVDNPVSLPSRGGSRVCAAWSLYNFGALLKKDNTNYEYKIRRESEYLFRAPPRALRGQWKWGVLKLKVH
jgi:hypothetical protein